MSNKLQLMLILGFSVISIAIYYFCMSLLSAHAYKNILSAFLALATFATIFDFIQRGKVDFVTKNQALVIFTIASLALFLWQLIFILSLPFIKALGISIALTVLLHMKIAAFSLLQNTRHKGSS